MSVLEPSIICLYHILDHLEAEDISRCAQVSRTWRDACYRECVWEKLCRRRWKYWKIKPKNTTGWRQVFLARATTDKWALEILNDLANCGALFLANTRKLRQLGDNARDVLLWVMNKPDESSLTHSYFAKRTLQCTRRYHVINQWRAWRDGNIQFSTIHGFGLMAILFNERIDLEDVITEINMLAGEFMRLHPPDAASPLDRFYALAAFFTQKYGSNHSYYEIETKLMYMLHPITETKGSKASILAIIFEELARQCGIPNVEIVADRERRSYRRYHFVRYYERIISDTLEDSIEVDDEYAVYFIDFKKHSTTGVMAEEIFDQHALQYYGAYSGDYIPIPQAELFVLFVHDYCQNLSRLLGHSSELFYGAALQRQFLTRLETNTLDFQLICRDIEDWWTYIAVTYQYPEDYELAREALRDVAPYFEKAQGADLDLWNDMTATIQSDIELLETNDGIEWDYSGKVQRGVIGERDPQFFIGDVVYFGKFGCLGVVCRWDRVFDIEIAETVGKFAYCDRDLRPNQPFYEILTRRGTFLYCAEEKLQLEPATSDRLTRTVPPTLYGDYTGDEQDWELAKALGPITTELVGSFFERWDPESGKYIMNWSTRKWFPHG